MTAMPVVVPRTWQLLTVGPGRRRITPDLHDRLVRLLDLLPQICSGRKRWCSTR